MAMKINAKVIGYGPDPEKTQALVTSSLSLTDPRNR